MRNKKSDAFDLNDSYDVEESVTSSAVFDSPTPAHKEPVATVHQKQVAAGRKGDGEDESRRPPPPLPALLGPPVTEADLPALHDTTLESSVVDDVMLGVTSPPSTPQAPAPKSSPETAPARRSFGGGEVTAETPPRGVPNVPATIILPRNLDSSDEDDGVAGGSAPGTLTPLVSPLKDVETGALSDETDGSRLRRRRRCLIVVAVISLLVLAAVVGTLAYLLGSSPSPRSGDSTNPSTTVPGAGKNTDDSDEGEEGNHAGDDSGSLAPSPVAVHPPPSSAPTISSELYRMALMVTPRDVLDDPSTPQGMAIRWLTGSAGSYSSPSEDKMLQRYAMTVLEMVLHPNNAPQSSGSNSSTNLTSSDNSTKVLGPLPGYESKDECEWFGITCSTAGNTTSGNETNSSSGSNATSDSSSPPGMVVSLNWAKRGIQGKIPTEIGLLTTLETLDLAENELEGWIPAALWNLTDLRYLYLHQNKLSGPISNKISRLSKLVKFYAGENRLTGTLPTGLASPGKGADNGRPLRTYFFLARLPCALLCARALDRRSRARCPVSLCSLALDDFPPGPSYTFPNSNESTRVFEPHWKQTYRTFARGHVLVLHVLSRSRSERLYRNFPGVVGGTDEEAPSSVPRSQPVDGEPAAELHPDWKRPAGAAAAVEQHAHGVPPSELPGDQLPSAARGAGQQLHRN